MLHLRAPIAVLSLTLLAGISSCGRPDNFRSVESRRAAQDDADTAARKAGRAAYKASEEAGKLAVKAGREFRVKAREAHEGWKDAQRESRDRRK